MNSKIDLIVWPENALWLAERSSALASAGTSIYLDKRPVTEHENNSAQDRYDFPSVILGYRIGGFNVSFRLSAFPSGLSNIVAIDEIRAGISPIDSRGVWGLGMAGSSITGAHPGGPNSRDVGDGITSCGMLTLTIGEQQLKRMGMPCTLSTIQSNFAATARSQHAGLVNILRLDGSVDTIADQVESIVWLSLHSRDPELARQLP